MSTQETANTSRIALMMNSRPPRTTAFVYQAIILSLSAHIFVLLVMFLVTSSPAVEEEQATEAIEEIELKLEEDEPQDDGSASNTSEVVRNLLANAEAQRTNDRVNYSGKSAEQIQAEVDQMYRDMEQQEFNQLRSGRPDNSVPVQRPEDQKPKQDPKSQRTDPTASNNNPSDKSFSGPVSAEYALSGRDPKSMPKPTYRCKSFGKIVVNIAVDPTGAVIDASIDEGKSKGNDCIREESLKYAKRWKFDYKDSAPKKQNGTITFTFSAQ